MLLKKSGWVTLHSVLSSEPYLFLAYWMNNCESKLFIQSETRMIVLRRWGQEMATNLWKCWSVRQNFSVYEIKTSYHGNYLNKVYSLDAMLGKFSLICCAHLFISVMHHNLWMKIFFIGPVHEIISICMGQLHRLRSPVRTYLFWPTQELFVVLLDCLDV